MILTFHYIGINRSATNDNGSISQNPVDEVVFIYRRITFQNVPNLTMNWMALIITPHVTPHGRSESQGGCISACFGL